MPIQLLAEYLIVPCTMLVFLIGFHLGRVRVKDERQVVLRALSSMMQSTDRLSHDVDNHNTELADMGKSVAHMDVSMEMETVQKSLVAQIADVIASNKKLEDDLTCARYTLLRQSEELDQSRKEARTDALSQLNNRKAFDETLEYWMSKFKRRGRSFALMISDIDHFKWINDTHGHRAGDRLVRGVADILKTLVGRQHFVARYGGDEFVFLLACGSRTATIELAKKLRAATERFGFSARGDGERVAVTFSTGIAFVREGDTAEALFRRADSKLYQAKQAGRNCLCVEGDDEETPPYLVRPELVS